ncbi:hypothetical protein R9C00_02615 [Flammeovirgaceae bacterium SG7u.111]|nr:hypothetical protein [Flammeovirgaceae bacterium SG7u.132]WPO36333.1 hypothetical protein R9C00_02615 [Flammeovirgaceae bacterium SG7u.111]
MRIDTSKSNYLEAILRFRAYLNYICFAAKFRLTQHQTTNNKTYCYEKKKNSGVRAFDPTEKVKDSKDHLYYDQFESWLNIGL